MRGILKRYSDQVSLLNNFLNDCRQSNDGSGGPIMKDQGAVIQPPKNHPIEQVGTELRSKMKFLELQRTTRK